jgi:glycosyltransferase involved in cell wall biosynthesis
MLIVLTSHPIQYQAPLWRALAEELGKGREARGKRPDDDRRGGVVPFEVWFLTDQGVRRTEDRDFGKAFAWDVDLLSGYPHRFLELRGQWDMRKFGGIPLAKPIGESLREANATALWVEGWRFKPFWNAVSAAKKMGIPVFLRGETSDKITEKGGLFGLVRNFALHRLFAKVDYFLAIGQASRRFYLRHGVPEAKLVYAPYGVDNEFFWREAERVRQGTGDRGQESGGEGQESGGEGGAQGAHFERDNFYILTEGQRTIRAEWNIPLDAKVVMFCGKFVGKKRPGDLVEALALHQRQAARGKGQVEARDTGHEASGTLSLESLASSPLREAQQSWHLLFVGSGELGEELRGACDTRFDAECQNDKISKSQNAGAPPATFAGFLNQSEIAKAYAVADVVVLPSEAWETWGLVVSEATAAGVPTVVSDCCGCSEDFAAKNPFTRVFPMGDAAAMARAIEEVLALEAEPEDVTKFADAFSPRITAEAVAERLTERRVATDGEDKRL